MNLRQVPHSKLSHRRQTGNLAQEIFSHLFSELTVTTLPVRTACATLKEGLSYKSASERCASLLKERDTSQEEDTNPNNGSSAVLCGYYVKALVPPPDHVI